MATHAIQVETIAFEADGKTHTAVVAEPRPLVENQMTREYEGETFGICISLSGGFVAHRVA